MSVTKGLSSEPDFGNDAVVQRGFSQSQPHPF